MKKRTGETLIGRGETTRCDISNDQRSHHRGARRDDRRYGRDGFVAVFVMSTSCLRLTEASASVQVILMQAFDESKPASKPVAAPETDSAQAWLRLAATVLLSTIGGIGMWSVVVALPAVQSEFGIPRAEASLPFTLAMLGFAAGGVAMGRLLDRVGIFGPVSVGAVVLGIGYVIAAGARSPVIFALAHALIGFGSSATLGPLMADISKWSVRRLSVAVTLCSAGNYFAGALWPPIVQHAIAAYGWRATHAAIGPLCGAAILAIAFAALRRHAPIASGVASGSRAAAPGTLGLSPGALQALLAVASVCCCVAMSMPQV